MKKAMPSAQAGAEGKPRSSRSILIKVAVLCLCLLFAMATPAQQAAPTFATFEAPGAGTGMLQEPPASASTRLA